MTIAEQARQVLIKAAPPEWSDSDHGRRAMAHVLDFAKWAWEAGVEGEVFRGTVLTGWLDALGETGLSAASRNRRLSAVLKVWRRAHRRGLIDSSPPEGLYEREGRGRRRTLSIDEERRLFDALGEPYRSLAALLTLTGLRVSEALALTWADLLFPPKDGTIARVVVRDSKNGDARTVPVRADLLTLALEHAPKFDEATARRFADGAGASIDGTVGPFSTVSQSAFNKAFSAAREALGLAKDAEFVPHALRHTYATRLVVAGVPLSVVARLMGHRSVRTTMRYSHVSDQDAENWIARLA